MFSAFFTRRREEKTMPMELINANMENIEADAAVVEETAGAGGFGNRLKQRLGLGAAPLQPGAAAVEHAKSGKAKFIIRAALPRWQGGGAGEMDALAKACAHAISLAREFGFHTLAIPLLGIKGGYPTALVLHTEMGIISVALLNDDMRILLVQDSAQEG